MGQRSLLLRHFYADPYTLEKLVTLLWHYALKGMDEFVETYQVGRIRIEYIKDEGGFVVGYVNFKVADNLLKLVEANKPVLVCIRVFQAFLKN